MTTYTYNNDGTLASNTDTDTGITAYAYDTYKRLNQITRPDGNTILIAYNLNDQITSITDENNHTYSYQYDANGNLIRVTDPKSNNTQYAYDLMDRVNQVTDRLSKVSSYAYDNMNRLQSFTDPNSIATGYGYNTRGWLNAINLGGQTWSTGYDDEGIVSSTTTPLNYTTTYQSDKLGFLTGITNPLNQTTTLTRDSMSRITGVTDPLNRTTSFGYENRGLLSSVTMPVIGTATYQRNDLGLLSQITDLNSNNWTFNYTHMGRISSSTDPLGNTWSQTYDTRGRRSQTTYPDGSTLTRTYDDAGNLTRRLYSGGPDIEITYNELNMRTATNGIAFTRDNENRITATDNPGTVFGVTYDNGGRLSTSTYNNGAFIVTYTYDSTTGLLSRVTDNLTGAQIDFTYDNDRKLTGMTRSNGVNTTLTWDDAGRLTRIQDGPSAGSGFIDLQYGLDAAGQVTSANMTVPLDPRSLLQSGTETFTYGVASQLSTSGYSYDQRGRLTAVPGNTFSWDGASRLVGIGGAALAYNGLGDLVTRTESGNTIHYYYNYAIGLKPIVAEKNITTDQFLRYYVWTPGGKLLYMIDASDGNKVYFYHFDRVGSTLALSDSSGTVTDKYAYDPYGEVSHQGSSPQPFTFVGKWGVRQEGSTGTVYHMRARYYDAVTAHFLSRESAWPRIHNSMALNPYQYAYSDPIKWVDVDGRAPSPTGSSTANEIVEGIKMGTDFSTVLNFDESAHVTGKGSVAMGSWTDIYYNNRDWQEMIYKGSYEGAYEREIREGEQLLKEQKMQENIRQGELEKERVDMVVELMKGGLDVSEAEAFVNWLQKQNFGAWRKQREIDFAIGLGMRKSSKKVKGVWVIAFGMGRKFIPGARIENNRMWNPKTGQWESGEQWGVGGTATFEEGLGPAGGYFQGSQ